MDVAGVVESEYRSTVAVESNPVARAWQANDLSRL
jgi:hypothetical protein